MSLFHNRDGDAAFLNLKADSPHMVVAAQTGAGKSFLVNRILMDLLRKNARIFVIDIGGSYRRLCRLIGGRYLELSMENPLTINPLSVDRVDDKNLGMLVRAILRLAGEMKRARASSTKSRKTPLSNHCGRSSPARDGICATRRTSKRERKFF
jgi:conjugal transfer ATP-binding protein TraC